MTARSSPRLSGVAFWSVPEQNRDRAVHDLAAIGLGSSEMLGVPLSPAFAAVGKALGSPWQQDHKDATAAALVSLGAL